MGVLVCGFFDDYGRSFLKYTMQNGFLNANDSQGVFGSFNQINGTNHVSGDLSVNAPLFMSGNACNVQYVVGAGVSIEPGVVLTTHFLQSGGCILLAILFCAPAVSPGAAYDSRSCSDGILDLARARGIHQQSCRSSWRDRSLEQFKSIVPQLEHTALLMDANGLAPRSRMPFRTTAGAINMPRPVILPGAQRVLLINASPALEKMGSQDDAGLN